MSIAIPVAIASQAIPTAINLVKAYKQNKQSKELFNTPRPPYNIPQGLQDAVQQARYIAGMRELPGQNLMEQRLGANLGTGVSELKNVSSNPSDLASNVARLYSSQNQGINDIGMAAGQNWLNNQSGLNVALQQLAKAQDREWDYNKFQPYQNNMAAASALKEGAFRNLSAAGTNLASTLTGVANILGQQEYLKKIEKAQREGKNAAGTALGTIGNISQAIASPNVPKAPMMTDEQKLEYLKDLLIQKGTTTSMSGAQLPGAKNQLVDDALIGSFMDKFYNNRN